MFVLGDLCVGARFLANTVSKFGLMAGRNLFFVPGNHDTYKTLYSMRGNIHGRVALIDGVRIAGFGLIRRTEEEPATNLYGKAYERLSNQKADILLTHDGIYNSEMRKLCQEAWGICRVQRALLSKLNLFSPGDRLGFR